MKAAILERHGPPDVLRMADLPDPVPTPYEYVLRVYACGLNHGLDGRTRQDGAGRKIKFPHVLGSEIVGEIVAAGRLADPALVGRFAIVVPWITCGACPECLLGEHNACERKILRGIDFAGGYSEYVVSPAEHLIFLNHSGRADLTAAAALPISYTTAWHMLQRRAKIGPKDVILVLGAAGTIGIACLQIARLVGARSLAAASVPEKHAVARRFGASAIIDSSKEDIATRVREETGGRGVDVVVEHVGAATWDASLASLAPNGRLVMCGATTGWDLRFDARSLWRRNISLLFSNSGTTQDLRDVVDAWSSGDLEPLIAKTFRLQDVAAAHAALGDRSLIGKIVLDLS